MTDYKQLYSKMFNAITDTIESLKQVQIEAEEDYLKLCESDSESKIVQFNKNFEKISKNC